LGAYGDYFSSDQALTAELVGSSATTFPLPVPFINESVRGNATNWGPRVGVAWDPMHDGRLNIHAGYGIYYDNMRTLQLGGEITWPMSQSIIISNPSFPDPLQGQSRNQFVSTAPPNITVLANDLRILAFVQYRHDARIAGSVAITADFTT
jgi:hypothetical protein